MKNKSNFILYLIIIILSVIIIRGYNKEDINTKSIENQLISNQAKIDSLNDINSNLNNEIQLIRVDLRYINTQLQTNKNELNNLKEENKIKQQQIDNYDYYQLMDFINIRYSDNIR